MARKEVEVKDLKPGDRIGFVNFIRNEQVFDELSNVKVTLIVKDSELEMVAVQYEDADGNRDWLVCDHMDDTVDRWEP